MRKLAGLLVSVAAAGCAGAPGEAAPSGGAVVSGAPPDTSGDAPPASSPDPEPLPARPLDEWERGCTAAARDAARAASSETTPHTATFGCLTVVFGNEMGSSFQLTQAVIQIDGQIALNRV